MSLDLRKLERVRRRDGRVIARCPACAETGSDRSCDHLSIDDDGRGGFSCVVFSGLQGTEHRKRIWKLAGLHEHPGCFHPLPSPRPKIAPRPTLKLPPLRRLSDHEMAAIIELRDWPSPYGLEMLSQRGLLWHARVYDNNREWPAWLINDSAQRNAQARRLDGESWCGIGGKKAKSLPHSDSRWPIGAADIGPRRVVVLCEGQPDFCASLLVAKLEGVDVESIAPVAMTGASNSIHPDALPLFASKHVRIAIHCDDKGRDAAQRWARQLYDAGAACVDGFDFAGLVQRDGHAVKDLADYAMLCDSTGSHSPAVFAGLK